MAGMFDGWDTGQGGGTGIFPPWLTQLLQQTPPDVLLQGIQALTGGSQQPPQQAPTPTGDPMVPPAAQFASMAPQGQGYEPRKSIFDRPDSIPGQPDQYPGAPQGGMQPPMAQGSPMQLPGASAMAQAPQQQQGGGMPSFGGGLMDLGFNVFMPRTMAKYREQQQQAQITNMTAQAFMKKGGLDAQTAYAIAADPVMRKEYAQQLFAKPEAPLVVNGKVVGRDGKLIADHSSPPDPVKLSPGDSLYTREGKELVKGQPAGPKIDDVTQIRKEVSALPEVKRYGEAITAFNTMATSHNKDSAAADLAFVYGVAKIFDPDSVVREGEMKLVGSAQSIPEDVKGFIKRAAYGEGRLDAAARGRILEVAKAKMEELDGAVKTRTAPYDGIAERFGIRRDDIQPVLPKIAEIEQPAAATTAAPAAPKIAVGPNGVKIILKDGKWVPYR
jgi:hypothetical protein